MIKAFIFDMDGVIINSEPLQLKSFNHVLKQSKISVSMEEFKKRYMGYQDIQISDMMIADFNLPTTKEKFVSEKRKFYKEILKYGNIQPIPGVIEAIKGIQNMMPIAIASSSNKTEIEIVIEHFGVRGLFSVLVSSYEVEKGKPAPDIYLRVNKLVGVSPKQCGVIEDTKVGVRAAKSAKMHCIGITTTHEENELAEADKVIHSFDELIPIIKEL